ncbi:hypothetical protein G7Z17_g1199 [Cylindrodendrum hubeiense]|uniref:protein acetyllysine N-acetyltransferase n=1 Tax=Cylindrodendrum hubeiense TaxID=595255 RepID=A0A9P5HIT2_9HYPO|nr:hypothetical protein G7Z17_g1199 [Cylindrodendrum hubeiense]
MVSSAPKVPDVERREEPDELARKAKALATQIWESKHFIAFTGAGISTSAGPEGVWTLRAQGRKSTGKAVNTLQAIPTPTHMTLFELQNRGILNYLISQNCDGLHRRSGILPTSELLPPTKRRSMTTAQGENVLYATEICTTASSILGSHCPINLCNAHLIMPERQTSVSSSDLP